MLRDFDYRPRSGVIIAYRDGKTYERVPEGAAAAIKAAQAGEIIPPATKKAGENDKPVA